MATVTMPEVDPVAGLEDGSYEIIGGRVVEAVDRDVAGSRLISRLFRNLILFDHNLALGEYVSGMLFRLDDRNLRKSDLAFVSKERWPKGKRSPDTNAWDVVPDLAIEVMSKSDIAEDLSKKIRLYFKVGVRAVWIFYPEVELVHVYDSLTSIRVLTRTDVLDGGEILPNFRLPLDTVFEPEEPTS